MVIGLLKEHRDRRVALLPEHVAELVKLKVKVLVNTDAGNLAYSSNEEYQNAGASLVTFEDVLQQSDVVVKVKPPHDEMLALLRDGIITISMLNPFINVDLVKTLATKGVTAFGLEMIPRTTRAQAMDVLSSQSTIAGYKAVLDAARRFPRFFPMFMSAAGTIKPAKVLVIGAGVAGLQAIATAKRLGAVVEAFDVRSAVREEVKSLGGKFVEVEGAQESKAAGGYAIEQSPEYLIKQAQVIHEHASHADIIICTAQIPGRKAPILIKKETVDAMRAGSIIIDLAASTGGNCEYTKNNEAYEVNGVYVVGNSYFASEMPADSSKMFGRNVMNFLKLIINTEGGLNLNFDDDIVKGTCVTHGKAIVNERILKSYNL